MSRTSPQFQSFWKELAPLPEGARPVLQAEEVECIMRERVSVVDGLVNTAVYKNGVAILTSRRILWYQQPGGLVIEGHLSLVVNASKSRNFLKPSSRVHVFVKGQAGQRGEEAATKLEFHQGGKEEFLEQLRYVLQMKEWERVLPRPPGQLQGGEPVFTTSKAGISGIFKQKELERRQEGKLAEEAFADLSSLMTKAKEVVAVVERYAAVMARKREEGAGGEDAETQELQGVLRDMGIANPVTRMSAGSMYHQELARQMAQFLKLGDQLGVRGGVMTLPDVFCLFNRARGTELISPDDLLDACNLLEGLRLGMHLRAFQSGVLVIQADDFSEAKVAQRVRALADTTVPLTALDVASSLGVSITLAQEFVKASENAGLLCRDESAQGALFYPNRFPEFVARLGTKATG